MVVEYDITRSDAQAYGEYLDRRSPMARWGVVFLLGFLFAVGFGAGALDHDVFGLSRLLSGLVAGLLPVALIGVLCLMIVVLPALIRRLRPGPWSRVLSRCRAALDERGVCYADEQLETRWAWEAVRSVIEDRKHLFIRAAPHTAVGGAIVIPKRAFETERGIQAFLDELRRRQQQATRTTPDETPDALQVHCTLTPEDRASYLEHRMSRAGGARWGPFVFVAIALALILTAIIRADLRFSGAGRTASAILWALLMLACVFIIVGVVHGVFLLCRRLVPRRLTTQTVRIEPSGVCVRDARTHARWRWTALDELIKSKAHVFLRMAPPAGIKTPQVITIPERAFESAPHMQAFLDEVNRLRAQAAGDASAASTADDSTSPSSR
jgi:hypothetical protein